MRQGSSTSKRRLCMALMLVGDENWMGGVYYVRHILEALRHSDHWRIVVFYNKGIPADVLQEVKAMSDITCVSIDNESPLLKVYNAFHRKVLGKNWFLNRLCRLHQVDVVYPLLKVVKGWTPNADLVYWIPDFQHRYLPDYFSEVERLSRDATFAEIAEKAKHVVLSSHDAARSFRTFYPKSGARTHVLHFASPQHVRFEAVATVQAKYGIRMPYALVSNQFWKHKNHGLVVDAMDILARDYSTAALNVVFTGKEHDHRHPEYAGTIKERLARYPDHGDGLCAMSLGFIPREDQLALMAGARLVVQPSRFEGWGTVVEDAKSLRIPVVASDLPVHREQLPFLSDRWFFNPDDASGLARCLAEVMVGNSLPETSEPEPLGAFTARLEGIFGDLGN